MNKNYRSKYYEKGIVYYKILYPDFDKKIRSV